MDRYGNQMASQMAAPSMGYGAVGAGQQTVAAGESLATVIERFAKAEDFLGAMVNRARGLRDKLDPPGAQKTDGDGTVRGPFSGAVGALHCAADAITDHTSALNRILDEIAQAIG